MVMSDKARKAKNEYQREWRSRNRAKVNAYQRKWRSRNREKAINMDNDYWERKADELGIE